MENSNSEWSNLWGAGQHQVVTLTPADRTVTSGPEATRRDFQHPAQAFNRNLLGMFFDNGKSHLFNPVKNTVAFFKSSLSSMSNRFSLPSSSFSFARTMSAAGGKSAGQDLCIHFASVEKPTPRSEATCRRGCPMASAIRTASR